MNALGIRRINVNCKMNLKCPHCQGELYERWEFDPTDPRPWADPYFIGGVCENCKKFYNTKEIDEIYEKQKGVKIYETLD